MNAGNAEQGKVCVVGPIGPHRYTVTANLIIDFSSETKLVDEDRKSAVTAIVAPLSFRINFVFSNTSCAGSVVADDIHEVRNGFGQDSLAKRRNSEFFWQGMCNSSMGFLVSQTSNHTLIETMSVGGNMNHQERLS